MASRWSAWQAELERISPFSAEWNDEQPEEFIHILEEVAARKRAQRAALERLGEELKKLRASYAGALAFFDLDRACQSWSECNYAGGDVDRVLQALAQWRAVLTRYNDVFPPPEERVRTYSALQECAMEAAAAMAAIRPGFGTLTAAFAAPAEAPPAELVRAVSAVK